MTFGSSGFVEFESILIERGIEKTLRNSIHLGASYRKMGSLGLEHLFIPTPEASYLGRADNRVESRRI